MKYYTLILTFLFYSNCIATQTLFSETFNETGTSGSSAEGISWSCSPFCNPAGVFSSNGSILRCQNPKETVTWTTGDIDVSNWSEVQLVINFAVAGDIEGACNLGSSCECSPVPNDNSPPCPVVSSFDFLDIGYLLDGSQFTIPDQLLCTTLSCDPPCGGGLSSCDVSGGGVHTYYGDCLNGAIDDNDMNNGSGSATFNLVWTINTTGVDNLSLSFSMRNNAGTEQWDFQDITITGTVLPVELLKFDAKKISQKTHLSWSTASETNNAHFRIERGADGRVFTEIGRVAGAGTVRETREYAFIDERPLPGANFYRLRQVDFDGRFSFSPVRRVVVGQAAGAFLLYPSPASDFLQIQLAESADTDSAWEIFDAAGRQVMRGVLPAESAALPVFIGDLLPGAYYFRLVSGQNLKGHSFVKQ